MSDQRLPCLCGNDPCVVSTHGVTLVASRYCRRYDETHGSRDRGEPRVPPNRPESEVGEDIAYAAMFARLEAAEARIHELEVFRNGRAPEDLGAEGLLEALEQRVGSLEQTRVGVDMVTLIEKACTCGVGAKAGMVHSPDCKLSRQFSEIAMRAGS